MPPSSRLLLFSFSADFDGEFLHLLPPVSHRVNRVDEEGGERQKEEAEERWKSHVQGGRIFQPFFCPHNIWWVFESLASSCCCCSTIFGGCSRVVSATYFQLSLDRFELQGVRKSRSFFRPIFSFALCGLLSFLFFLIPTRLLWPSISVCSWVFFSFPFLLFFLQAKPSFSSKEQKGGKKSTR